jgi:hypothetical protein
MAKSMLLNEVKHTKNGCIFYVHKVSGRYVYLVNLNGDDMGCTLDFQVKTTGKQVLIDVKK